MSIFGSFPKRHRKHLEFKINIFGELPFVKTIILESFSWPWNHNGGFDHHYPLRKANLWVDVGGCRWVKKAILKGKRHKKVSGLAIVSFRLGQREEKRSKKGLKGSGRRIVSFRLVQARPLKPLLLKNSTSFRHKLAKPKKPTQC